MLVHYDDGGAYCRRTTSRESEEAMKRLTVTLLILTAPLVVLNASARPVAAQSMFMSNPYSGYASTIHVLYGNEVAKRALGIGKSSGSTATTSGAKAVKAVPATRFKPTGKRLTQDSFVDSLTKTKEEKDMYHEIFGEVFKAYEAEAQKKGFANDIAGAMTFFVEANYMAYRSGAKVSDSGTQAMILHFQTSLDNETMRNSSDAEKQKMYETFILLGGFTMTGYQVAVMRKNTDLQKTMQKMGGDGLRYLLKAEPECVRITDKGLEIEPEDIIPLKKSDSNGGRN
jgi:hypothetical protein